jgi:UDP-glucuronate 4-epimerase
MLDGRPITIYGDGEQSRSNTFISDAVQATVGAIDGGVVGEVYNVAGGEEITVNAAIAAIADILGVNPILEHAPGRPGDQRRTSADTTKARTAFGYTPTVGPVDGLAAQAAWQAERRTGRLG